MVNPRKALQRFTRRGGDRPVGIAQQRNQGRDTFRGHHVLQGIDGHQTNRPVAFRLDGDQEKTLHNALVAIGRQCAGGGGPDGGLLASQHQQQRLDEYRMPATIFFDRLGDGNLRRGFRRVTQPLRENLAGLGIGSRQQQSSRLEPGRLRSFGIGELIGERVDFELLLGGHRPGLGCDTLAPSHQGHQDAKTHDTRQSSSESGFQKTCRVSAG